MTVWKFQVWRHSPVDYDAIEMPESAKIVHVAMQGEWLCFWALVDPKLPTELRRFLIRGTGHEIQDGLEYIGTAHDESFVWHLFEER